MSVHSILSAVQLLSTPALAAVAAYIAYRQWRTANDKLKLDLYNRRFNIFTAVVVYCDFLVAFQFMPENQASLRDEEAKFKQALREARFLFSRSDNVISLLNLIESNCGMLSRLISRAYTDVLLNKDKPGLAIDWMVKLGPYKGAYHHRLLREVNELSDALTPYLGFQDIQRAPVMTRLAAMLGRSARKQPFMIGQREDSGPIVLEQASAQSDGGAP